MTVLHYKPPTTTEDLRRRTGQQTQEEWYADVERRCEALARQKRTRERRKTALYSLLLLLALVAVIWLVPVP